MDSIRVVRDADGVHVLPDDEGQVNVDAPDRLREIDQRRRGAETERARREAEREAARENAPIRYINCDFETQQSMESALRVELTKRGAPNVGMLATSLAAHLYATKDGAVQIGVQYPAETFDHAPRGAAERQRYMAVTTRLHPLAEGLGIMLAKDSPGDEIARRRERAAQLQEQERAEAQRDARRQEQIQQRNAQIRERREIYSAARLPRAILELADRVRTDADFAKQMKDPFALLKELAAAIQFAPLETNVNPPALAVEVLRMEPLIEVEK